MRACEMLARHAPTSPSTWRTCPRSATGRGPTDDRRRAQRRLVVAEVRRVRRCRAHGERRRVARRVRSDRSRRARGPRRRGARGARRARAARHRASSGGRAPAGARRPEHAEPRDRRRRAARRARARDPVRAAAPARSSSPRSRAVRARFGDVPQVVCFDTGFHRTLPDGRAPLRAAAALFEPGSGATAFTACRTSTSPRRSLAARSCAGPIFAHLGNGASMVAVRDGRSIDTTMGLTPAGGLVMGTRSGDLDPGLLLYLLEHGYDAARLAHLIDHEAGLLGALGDDLRHAAAARARARRAARRARDRRVLLPGAQVDRRARGGARRARHPGVHRRHRRARGRDPSSRSARGWLPRDQARSSRSRPTRSW